MYKVLPYVFIFIFSSLIISLVFTREFKEFISENFSFGADEEELHNKLKTCQNIVPLNTMTELTYFASIYFEKFEKDFNSSKEYKNNNEVFFPASNEVEQYLEKITPAVSRRIKECSVRKFSFSPA